MKNVYLIYLNFQSVYVQANKRSDSMMTENSASLSYKRLIKSLDENGMIEIKGSLKMKEGENNMYNMSNMYVQHVQHVQQAKGDIGRSESS
jgi:hypothetical protein